MKTWDNDILLQYPLVLRLSFFFYPPYEKLARSRAGFSQTQDDTNVLDDDTQVKVAPSQVVGKRNRGQKQFGYPTEEAPNSSTPMEVVTQTPIYSTQVPSIPINLASSLIHPQHVTQQHLVGNKLVLPLTLLCHMCLL